MQRQEAIGVFFLADAVILLITGLGGYQELFVLAMVTFAFGLMYLGAYKNGTIGPFKRPFIVTYIVILLGFYGGFAYRKVPDDPAYILGFTPGAAFIVFLVWIFPVFLGFTYGYYVGHFNTGKESIIKEAK